MTDHFLITPSPELVEQWLKQSLTSRELAAKAFQAGADQELEACCEWFRVKGYHPEVYRDLRSARRPKPPSLKAGALEVLDDLDGLFDLPSGHYNTLLRALEQLDD